MVSEFHGRVLIVSLFVLFSVCQNLTYNDLNYLFRDFKLDFQVAGALVNMGFSRTNIVFVRVVFHLHIFLLLLLRSQHTNLNTKATDPVQDGLRVRILAFRKPNTTLQ